MASSYRSLLVLVMATSFMAMGLTNSLSPSGSPASSPTPLFSNRPNSSQSPAPSPSSKMKPPVASPPAPVHSPPAVSPVPEISPASISQSPSSNVAPQPATNAAVTLNFNTSLAVGSVAAVICVLVFLV